MSSHVLLADENSDSFTQLRNEEISAKKKRVEDLGGQVETLQKQLDQERKTLRSNEERIWKEFSQSLEVERKEMKSRLEMLDERQRLFELELEKKRQQDETQVREKEDEMKRLLMQMERLRTEAERDRKELDEYTRTSKKERAAVPPKELSPAERGGEVLQNGMIKITGIKGRDLMGEESFPARKIRPEYYVEIGDIFEIDVWRSPDLTRAVTVRPDGRISMPLVGDLEVAGLTLVQVRDEMTKRFSEYIRNPQVSLSIRQFGGRKFIILGEVKSPGVYRFQQDISLLEGIALAGGFDGDARRGKIMIIRGDIKKEPQVKTISANLENVLKRGVISENLTILSNDIIYVGKDFLGDYNQVLKDLIEPSLDKAIDFFVLRSAIRISQQKRN